MEGQVSAFIASLDTGLAYKFGTSLPAIKVGVFLWIIFSNKRRRVPHSEIFQQPTNRELFLKSNAGHGAIVAFWCPGEPVGNAWRV